MLSTSGLSNSLYSACSLTVAAISALCAILQMWDRHVASEKAKSQGAMILSPFPLLFYLFLLLVIIFLFAGFWLIFHPPIQPPNTPVATTIPAASTPIHANPPKTARPRIRANHAMLDGDDVKKTVPSIRVDSNSGNIAGINIGTQTINYGMPHPPPDLIYIQQEALPAVLNPRQYSTNMPVSPMVRLTEKLINNPHPGVRLSFKVSEQFVNPMFTVRCDKPCEPVSILFESNGVGAFGGSGSPFISTNSPDTWIFTSGMRQMLTPDVKVLIEIRSVDDSPISVVSVSGYVR